MADDDHDITVRILEDIRNDMRQVKEDLRQVRDQGLRTADSLDRFRDEMHDALDDLRGEIGEVRSELRSEIGELRTELRGEIAGVRSELREFKEQTHANFAAVLHIVADVRIDLDRRVTRIEHHLKLTP